VDLRRALAAGLVCLAAACGGSATPAAPGVPARAGHPCTGAEPPARFAHVILIVLENHGFDQVAGHSPFLNALAHRCGLAAGYRAVAHPSLPNYLALTSGSTQGLAGQDCSPGPACRSSGASIFSQTPWRAYAESMSGRCRLTNAGNYAARHNPAIYYTRVAARCATADVPLSALPDDLRSGHLAPYSFIAPNLCSDEHDCAVSNGDAWLARWLPRLTASSVYRSGDTAIFITYDEDDYGEGNRVYTVVVARSVRPGTVSETPFTHYSMLRTNEQLLGLPPLGEAASAASMARAFHLAH
jgi:phosphatidylinositol-3-phosphatase